MPAPRLQINRPGVARLLQSTEMQRAVGRVAQDIAGRVSSALVAAPRAPRSPYQGLPVRVEITPNGGIRGDRAMATVIVAPPAGDEVRFSDRRLRFGVVAQVAGEVSRR
jgi:hypothetical protein